MSLRPDTPGAIPGEYGALPGCSARYCSRCHSPYSSSRSFSASRSAHGAAVPASRFCQLRLADSHGLLADVSADGEYLLPVAVRRVCLCVVADDPVELAMLRDQPVLGGPLGRECCPRCRRERGDAGHGAFVLNPGEFGVLDQAGFVVKLRRYPVLLPVLAVALAHRCPQAFAAGQHPGRCGCRRVGQAWRH